MVDESYEQKDTKVCNMDLSIALYQANHISPPPPTIKTRKWKFGFSSSMLACLHCISDLLELGTYFATFYLANRLGIRYQDARYQDARYQVLGYQVQPIKAPWVRAIGQMQGQTPLLPHCRPLILGIHHPPSHPPTLGFYLTLCSI